MFKFVFLTIVVVALGYFGLTFMGYQVNTGNIVHYKPESNYFEKIKLENKAHPLISKKAGVSGAASLDKSVLDALKTVTQADKFELMERVKKDITKIQGVATERAKQVDNLTAS